MNAITDHTTPSWQLMQVLQDRLQGAGDGSKPAVFTVRDTLAANRLVEFLNSAPQPAGLLVWIQDEAPWPVRRPRLTSRVSILLTAATIQKTLLLKDEVVGKLDTYVYEYIVVHYTGSRAVDSERPIVEVNFSIEDA